MLPPTCNAHQHFKEFQFLFFLQRLLASRKLQAVQFLLHTHMGHLQLGDVRRCFDWLNVFNAEMSSEVTGSGRDPGRLGWRETIPYDSSHFCYRLFRSTPILLQIISFYTCLVTDYFVLHLPCYRLFRSTPILLQIISFYTYLVTDYFVLHLSCYRLFRSTPILLQVIFFYTYLVTEYFVLHPPCYRLFCSTPITTLTHALRWQR